MCGGIIGTGIGIGGSIGIIGCVFDDAVAMVMLGIALAPEPLASITGRAYFGG